MCGASISLLAAAIVAAQTADLSGLKSITTDELLNYLDIIERQQENLREVFEITWHYGDGTDQIPVHFDESQFVYSQRVSCIYSQERFRLEIKYLDTHPNLAVMNGQFHVLTWNGEVAKLTTLGAFSKDASLQGARIDNEPMREALDMPLMNWCGWWVYQFDYFQSFADLMRQCDVSGPRLLGDGKYQWRIFTPNRALNGEILLTARRADDNLITLAEAEFRVFLDEDGFLREDLSKRILSGIIRFHGEFSPLVQLPRNATVIHRHWPTDDNAPFWGVADIRLIEMEETKPNDELFEASISSTAFVGDMRYNIAYQLGERELNIDGMLYETHIPLVGDVGDRLEWWLSNAKPLSLEKPVSFDDEQPIETEEDAKDD